MKGTTYREFPVGDKMGVRKGRIEASERERWRGRERPRANGRGRKEKGAVGMEEAG